MKIAARIQYSELCRQLGIKSIVDLTTPDGKPVEAATSIRLRSVSVVDDDAKMALIERDAWEDDLQLADDPDALRDFIGALLAGDIGLARIAGDRLFENEGMRRACEAALFTPASRRAA